jgi:cell division protein ZapA
MSELIPVNVAIADRTYRLKVKASDEEVLRKTVKLINDKIIEFKNSFAGKDLQDYVSMVLLWFATEQGKSNTSLVEKDDISQKLQSLEAVLDKVLTEQ